MGTFESDLGNFLDREDRAVKLEQLKDDIHNAVTQGVDYDSHIEYFDAGDIMSQFLDTLDSDDRVQMLVGCANGNTEHQQNFSRLFDVFVSEYLDSKLGN